MYKAKSRSREEPGHHVECAEQPGESEAIAKLA
jgi:hypothetical protein